MLIQCTKKMLDQMKRQPESADNQEQPLFSWHANLLIINRRKAVVLMNDASHYVIVLYGLKAADFSRLDEYIVRAIRETWSDAFVKPEVIEQYLARSIGCVYTKTKNRTMVARLNKSCDSVWIHADQFVLDRIIQSSVSRRASNQLVGNGKGDYYEPSEKLYRKLEMLAGAPIFKCTAVTVRVTLQLEKHKVWRRIIVPVSITFEQFHEILQTIFGWTNSHLHEFTVYNGRKAMASLVCDEEASDFPGNAPMFMETDRSLSDFVSECTRIIYTYDFGDDWEHEIIIEDIDQSYSKNFPACLEGEGNTPPEDVGGEWGYEEYLKIMADPGHPEHDDRAAWSSDQFREDFDLNRVNARMKHIL